MTEYGLAGLRDKDGRRKTVDHSFDWNGETVHLKLDPPTVSQQEEYENLGDDVGAERLREIVDRHIVEPTIPDDEEWTTRELFCYLEGIMDFGIGGGGQLAQDVRDELEQREGRAGNVT